MVHLQRWRALDEFGRRLIWARSGTTTVARHRRLRPGEEAEELKRFAGNAVPKIFVIL